MKKEQIIEILKEFQMYIGSPDNIIVGDAIPDWQYEELADRLEQQPEKEYPFKCNKCGFEFTSDDLGHTYLTCTQSFPQRTSGICGGAIELNYLEQHPEVSEEADTTITDILWDECNKKGDLIDKAVFADGVSIETINNIFANAALRIQSHPQPISEEKIEELTREWYARHILTPKPEEFSFRAGIKATLKELNNE